jgi:hypothetical protein
VIGLNRKFSFFFTNNVSISSFVTIFSAKRSALEQSRKELVLCKTDLRRVNQQLTEEQSKFIELRTIFV